MISNETNRIASILAAWAEDLPLKTVYLFGSIDTHHILWIHDKYLLFVLSVITTLVRFRFCFIVYTDISNNSLMLA